jgi:hypothetical protein
MDVDRLDKSFDIEEELAVLNQNPRRRLLALLAEAGAQAV